MTPEETYSLQSLPRHMRAPTKDDHTPGVKMGVKWQLEAALLSTPADLSALVSVSLTNGDAFLEDDTLHRMVKLLLNENTEASEQHTKLDVLTILANLAKSPMKHVKGEVKMVLQGVSEWFDEYLKQEPLTNIASDEDDECSPELHKTMLLVLARTYDYALKTEDLLDLTNGDHLAALLVVVSLLEEGETYTAALTQSQARANAPGRRAQWERELVVERYEKDLVLQLCVLLRGFTHPAAYLTAPKEVDASSEDAEDSLTQYKVDEFAATINGILKLALSTHLLEKLAHSMHCSLFVGDVKNDECDDGSRIRRPVQRLLDAQEHGAVASVNEFCQNLYVYGSGPLVERHQECLLTDSAIIERMVLPYLELCMLEARLLSDSSQEKFSDARLNPGKSSTSPAKQALQDQAEGEDRDLRRQRQFATLASGVATSLRTLVMATFRSASLVEANAAACGGGEDDVDNHIGAHATWDASNPTAALLRASMFVASQPKVFALVCLLNANMNAVDLTTRRASPTAENFRENGSAENEEDADEEESGTELLRRSNANSLLHDLAHQAASMSQDALAKTLAYVQSDVHGLPVQRDVPSYAAVLSVLENASKHDNSVPRTPPRGRAQAKREAKGYRYNLNDNSDDDDDEEPLGRSQMKSEASARARRLQEEQQHIGQDRSRSMRNQREVDEDGEDDEIHHGSTHSEQPRDKHPSFQADAKIIAGGASEAKGSAGSSSQQVMEPACKNMESRFRLLGDLPSLCLQLNSSQIHSRNDGSSDERDDNGSHNKLSLTSASSMEAKQTGTNDAPLFAAAFGTPRRAPPELCCAINGHVMKEPVRARDSKLVFERATIRLWLATRGSVCPITHSPLFEDDLKPDIALRSKIMRWQIDAQQSSWDSTGGPTDDLYDF